jgi:hypothetical protein
MYNEILSIWQTKKNYLFGRSDYDKSRKKSDYMINTGRSKVLESGYYENQVWGALHKAWKGYTIAKNKGEDDKLVHYAEITQELQYDLGRQVTSFPEIGKSALAFHSLRAAQIAETNKSNNYYNHNQEQEVSDEEYDYQYEKEKFTDDNAHSEYFRDDYSEADRFSS